MGLDPTQDAMVGNEGFGWATGTLGGVDPTWWSADSNGFWQDLPVVKNAWSGSGRTEVLVGDTGYPDDSFGRKCEVWNQNPPQCFRSDSTSFNDATRLSQRITLQKRLRSLNKRSQSFSFQKKKMCLISQKLVQNIYFLAGFLHGSPPPRSTYDPSSHCVHIFC